MTAQEILRMIEEVSPDDTAKLDEIDWRTDCYLRNTEYPFKAWQICAEPNPESEYDNARPLYTRSRDALKAIRPVGWMFETRLFCNTQGEKNLGYGGLAYKNKNRIETPYLTEELAELYAIIQAIAHDRSQP